MNGHGSRVSGAFHALKAAAQVSDLLTKPLHLFAKVGDTLMLLDGRLSELEHRASLLSHHVDQARQGINRNSGRGERVPSTTATLREQAPDVAECLIGGLGNTHESEEVHGHTPSSVAPTSLNGSVTSPAADTAGAPEGTTGHRHNPTPVSGAPSYSTDRSRP